MIFTKKPDIFKPIFEVTGCFLENIDSEILMLQRQNTKWEPLTWWAPAWKVKNWETINQTMKREIKEETWIYIKEDKLNYFWKFYVKYTKYDFIYHKFYIRLDKEHKIILDYKEHKWFKWVYPMDALNLNLIEDEDFCIKAFYKI